jgi:hypothetical protein
MKKLLVVLLALVCIVTLASAKKMYFLNIDKGDLPGDSNGVALSLSEEHASTKGGMSLLVENTNDPLKEGCFFGECPPRKGVWDGFDVLKCDVFNPGSKPVQMSLVIKPIPNVYEKRIDFNFLCRPGKSTMEYELAGATSNDGNAFDWKKKMGQWTWCVGGEKGGKIYISNLRLETSDEGEKEEKGGKKEEKTEKKK